MSEIGIWYVPVANREEAQKISKTLLSEKMAACVNVLNSVESFYMWEGEISSSQESILIIKSSLKLANKLKNRIKELHSYNIPAIIQLPISSINEEYQAWILKNCLQLKEKSQLDQK